MNDLIERLLAGPQPDRHSGVIMEEAADEIERLRKCLQYEQHRAERIGTHGHGCWAWGPQHYECALREIESLRKERDDRLSDAKHYFEWLQETQAKLDVCRQNLKSTETNDCEYIAVLEARANKYDDQLTSYRAVMEQAVEALERMFDKYEAGETVIDDWADAWGKCIDLTADEENNTIKAITAMREALNTKGETK